MPSILARTYLRIFKSQTSMKAALFHNTDAGGEKNDQEELLAALKAAGLSFVSVEVDMAAIRAALSNDRFDLAVVAGGDGTVARVIATSAELLAAKEQVPPSALVPVGGLNNIACSLGIEGTIEDIVSGWRQGHLQPIDVGSAHAPWGQRCFVEAAGFGALTDGLSNIDASPDNPAEKKAIGRAAFLKAMERARPVSVELWLDGERVERELLMLEILNLPRMGPRLEFAPVTGPHRVVRVDC